MKKLLTLLILATIMIGCKKDEKEVSKPVNFVGTEWKFFWFFNSQMVDYYYRLDFKSDSKVDYYVAYAGGLYITSEGKATLNYSVEDASTATPKIHITGTLNDIGGNAGKGAKVDYVLTYSPQMNTIKPALNGDGKNYVQTK